MLTSTYGSVLLASVLACLVTTTGIYIITKYERWGSQNAVHFMSFAAGVLISVSFIHIIPKSFGMNEASHLLPAVEKENSKYTLISLGAGILVAVLIVISKG